MSADELETLFAILAELVSRIRRLEREHEQITDRMDGLVKANVALRHRLK